MLGDKKFRWVELLIGTLFIIVGFMAITYPDRMLKTLLILFGIAAVARGIFAILGYATLKEYSGSRAVIILVSGILNIGFGVLLFTNLGSGIIILGALFALWFIVDSFSNLMNLTFVKQVSKGHYILSVILNVLGLFLGISLFFDPIISAFTMSFLVGMYFVLTGMFHLIFIVGSRD